MGRGRRKTHLMTVGLGQLVVGGKRHSVEACPPILRLRTDAQVATLSGRFENRSKSLRKSSSSHARSARRSSDEQCAPHHRAAARTTRGALLTRGGEHRRDVLGLRLFQVLARRSREVPSLSTSRPAGAAPRDLKSLGTFAARMATWTFCYCWTAPQLWKQRRLQLSTTSRAKMKVAAKVQTMMNT